MNNKTLLITVLTCAIALSACGAQQTPPPATEAAAPTDTSVPPTQVPAPTDTAVPSAVPAAATDTPVVAQPASNTVSFVNDIKPIFDNRCINCHGVERVKEGLDLQTYEKIMAGSRNGSVIEPGDAENSYLVQQIVDGEMPDRGEPVTPEELQLIIDWVNQGALNN